MSRLRAAKGRRFRPLNPGESDFKRHHDFSTETRLKKKRRKSRLSRGQFLREKKQYNYANYKNKELYQKT